MQWPHHGAKTTEPISLENDAERAGSLTLCEDKVILFNEALEGVLLELVNIGSEGNGSQQAAEGYAVAHGGL